MDLEQGYRGFTHTDRVLGNALVTTIITLTGILYGKVPSVYQAHSATLKNQVSSKDSACTERCPDKVILIGKHLFSRSNIFLTFYHYHLNYYKTYAR